MCAETIRSIHRKEFAKSSETLHKIESNLEELVSMLPSNGLFLGLIDTTFQEYVEASQFYNFVTNKNNSKLISLADFNTKVPVHYTTFLHGLCDFIGELRRFILDALRIDDLDSSEAALGFMDDIYFELITLDYPNALLPGLRRKTDLIRGIIEKSRGDLTLAYNRKSLITTIEDASDKKKE